MPIDADGTIVGQSITTPIGPVSSYPTSGVVIGWATATSAMALGGAGVGYGNILGTFLFFPEARTILGGIFAVNTASVITALEGSSDTTNGQDGTWETASWPSGLPVGMETSSTMWRTGVKPATFTGAKATVRIHDGTNGQQVGAIHLYGVKYAGQTPDDIIFLDGDIAFAEYAQDKDFGDRPLGTTVVKQFKLKNVSPTLTAHTIVVTCNDADFAISADGTTYVTTFTVTSLGPGVSSPVYYIRNTTPSPGAALGPRMVRMSAAVGSYS